MASSEHLKVILLFGICALILGLTFQLGNNQLPVTTSSERHHGKIRNPNSENEQDSFPTAMSESETTSFSTQPPASAAVIVSRFLRKLDLWFQRFWSPLGRHDLSTDTSSSLPSRPRFELVFDVDSNKDKKTFQTGEINGIDVAFHNPFPARKLRGIALLIHGCRQQASDWFQLPEHRHIAAHLLRKRLALLAVTSSNRVTGCWSTRYPHWENEDVSRVMMATKRWRVDRTIPSTAPIYAVGISSGATMLSILSSSNEMPSMVGQALYISPGSQRALNNATKSYPSTLFVRLTTDRHYASASAIALARRALLTRNVPMVGELTMSKVQLTPTTLHHREPRISAELSRKIFEAATYGQYHKIEHAMKTSSDEEIVAFWRSRDSRRAAVQVMRVVQGLHEVSAVCAEKVANWLIAT